MATFPTLNRVIADDRQPDTGITMVIAPNGAPFGQSLYSDEYFIFTPTFINVSASQLTTTKTFYDTNKLLAFDFDYVHNGLTTVTYECYFMSPGLSYTPMESATYIVRSYFRGKEK